MHNVMHYNFSTARPHRGCCVCALPACSRTAYHGGSYYEAC